jgi:hypothetical protein
MFDTKRIQNLLGKVPVPPEDVLPHGATDRQCDDFVNRTGITLVVTAA